MFKTGTQVILTDEIALFVKDRPSIAVVLPKDSVFSVVHADQYNNDTLELTFHSGEYFFMVDIDLVFDHKLFLPFDPVDNPGKVMETAMLVDELVIEAERKKVEKDFERNMLKLDEILTKYGLPDKWKKHYGVKE